MKTAWIVIPAVAAAAVLGFVAQRWIVDGRDAATPVAVAAGGGIPNPLADGDGAEAPPVIPETLPNSFSLADREGRQRTLADWSGRPLMVNYWATWCAPCRREIPLLNELRREGHPANLEVIGIAVDFRDDVLEYARETPIDYPILIGEEEGLAAVQAMGMQPAFPFTVFADSRHRILTVKLGELHRDDADLILDRLAKVDADTLPLEQARDEIEAGLKELATARARQAGAEQG